MSTEKENKAAVCWWLDVHRDLIVGLGDEVLVMHKRWRPRLRQWEFDIICLHAVVVEILTNPLMYHLRAVVHDNSRCPRRAHAHFIANPEDLHTKRCAR